MRQKGASRPVFDASAILALLQGETGADQLYRLQPDALISAVNVAEVLAKLVSRGMPAAEARAAFDALHLETLAFDLAMASLAVRFVGRNISLGDRCFLAAAHLHGVGWTSDRELAPLLGKAAPPLKFFR